MKTITLTQPWASLMALGEKHNETRSWGTRYRGPLLIHAAKGFPGECKDLFYLEPFRAVFARHGIKSLVDLPLGQILARVELVDVIQISRSFTGSSQELAFGDYTPGRYAWVTRNIEKVGPFPAKGSLGLWEYPL